MLSRRLNLGACEETAERRHLQRGTSSGWRLRPERDQHCASRMHTARRLKGRPGLRPTEVCAFYISHSRFSAAQCSAIRSHLPTSTPLRFFVGCLNDGCTWTLVCIEFSRSWFRTQGSCRRQACWLDKRAIV